MASAAAGCFSRCFVHPMDTLRSRVMVSTSSTVTLRSAFRDLLLTDGLRGLYRGFGISIIMQAPAVATYLTTYDASKKHITIQTGLSVTSAPVHLASGLIAETVSAVFWVPMEVIKQRAQVRSIGAASSISIARDLLSREGPRALFSGYALTVGVYGPYAMIYFMAYERFKQWSALQCTGNRNATEELSTPWIASSAATAAAIAAAVTTPLDVIKTRLQTQGDIGGRNAYKGTFHAAKIIVAEEGLVRFVRGVSARVMWIMPGTAITMSTFEYLKKRFRLGA